MKPRPENTALQPTERVLPEDLGLEDRLAPARISELFVQGSIAALEPPLVALVGTRQPDGEGLAMARLLAERCAERGITVLSGGALGIDAAAHQGAVDCGGRTVVVLPSGIDRPYPLRHRALYARICAAGGAIVSQFPEGTPPTRWTFPRRNDLVSSLCDVMVLVQAPSSSGALLAATFARKIGRRVLVVPASPGDRRGAGCLALLRSGAELCEGPDDLFAALERGDGPLLPPTRATPRRRARSDGARESAAVPATSDDERPRATPPSRRLPPLDPAQQQCVDALANGPAHPDALSERTGLDPARTRSALVTLTLLGVLLERSDGKFTLA